LNYCVDTKYGKCSLFPTKERGYKFLVDGKEDPTEYYYCSTARSSDDMCGVEGKKYVRKYKKTKS
jgi:hypothetical protein